MLVVYTCIATAHSPQVNQQMFERLAVLQRRLLP